MQEPVDARPLLALREMQLPGKPDAVGRIIARFLDESAERVAGLQVAVNDGNAKSLEHAAHALKGIAGTVGANEMFNLAAHLEEIGREGRTEGAADLVTELEHALGRARPIFERLRDPA